MSYSRLPSETTSSHDDFISEDTDVLLPSSSLSEKRLFSSTGKVRACSDSWMLYVSIVAIIMTSVNLTWLTVDLYNSRAPSPVPTLRPSTYLGFDQLTRNTSSPNWPLKRFDFPEHFGILDSENGSAESPNTRRILLDDTHTVIMLFTAHDYGLENCAIASLFPTRGRIAPHRSYTGEGQIQSLEVWQLEVPSKPWSPLDPPTTYAWNTRPARRRMLGTLNATAIRDYTPSFHCPSQSSFLVEIACGSSDCKLDFIQDRAAPRFGFWLFQSEEERTGV